jgi:hypothetical protein
MITDEQLTELEIISKTFELYAVQKTGTEKKVGKLNPGLEELIQALRKEREDKKYLEKQSQGRWDKGEALKDHNCQLMEDNKVLREALEFYADESNYKDGNNIEPIIHDGGSKARETLALKEKILGGGE